MPPRQPVLIRIAAANRCSKAQADQLRAFFGPRISGIIGGDRVFAQSLEAIDQCAALREHFGGEALLKWAAAHPAH